MHVDLFFWSSVLFLFLSVILDYTSFNRFGNETYFWYLISVGLSFYRNMFVHTLISLEIIYFVLDRQQNIYTQKKHIL